MQRHRSICSAFESIVAEFFLVSTHAKQSKIASNPNFCGTMTRGTKPSLDDNMLKRALAEAHLPALLVTLAQLTGDTSLLREVWKPSYAPYSDGRTGGLAAPLQADIRSLASELILSRRSPSGWPQPKMSQEQLHSMIEFVAGATISERYLPLLREELGIPKDVEQESGLATTGPCEPAEKLKVVVIGAGMSGLLAGIQLKQAAIDFQIIERNPEVGGTWFENTYPGCRVDSQNHIYCYSFAPNHDWPQHFSTQDKLLSYFRDAVDRFALREHIQLETSVESAVFDEEACKWHVRAKRANGGEFELTADAIISAVGQLNMPKIPEIEGRDSFGGSQFHSARWCREVDLRGKRVAVVGTGASAFQIIPIVAAQCSHLDVFQRSAPWFMPTPDYHMDVGEGQKWLLKNLPFYANWYRFWLFWTISEGVMPALKRDPEWKASDGSINAAHQKIQLALTAQMKAQLGDRVDLIEKVVPKFPFGGKRTLRDPGQWIETLKRPNVDLISHGIARITPRGVVTQDGIEHPADVIIYGTGFHASRFLEPMKIFGRDGVELTQHWAGDAKAYLGMTIPAFPNFFCLYGPNTNLVAQGSIVFISECSMRYIIGALKLLLETGAQALEPRQSVFDAYNTKVDAANEVMAWGLPDVTNWYKSQSGRVSQNWPFALFDYWDATRAPDPDDFLFLKKGRRSAG